MDSAFAYRKMRRQQVRIASHTATAPRSRQDYVMVDIKTADRRVTQQLSYSKCASAPDTESCRAWFSGAEAERGGPRDSVETTTIPHQASDERPPGLPAES